MRVFVVGLTKKFFFKNFFKNFIYKIFAVIFFKKLFLKVKIGERSVDTFSNEAPLLQKY